MKPAHFYLLNLPYRKVDECQPLAAALAPLAAALAALTPSGTPLAPSATPVALPDPAWTLSSIDVPSAAAEASPFPGPYVSTVFTARGLLGSLGSAAVPPAAAKASPSLAPSAMPVVTPATPSVVTPAAPSVVTPVVTPAAPPLVTPLAPSATPLESPFAPPPPPAAEVAEVAEVAASPTAGDKRKAGFTRFDPVVPLDPSLTPA